MGTESLKNNSEDVSTSASSSSPPFSSNANISWGGESSSDGDDWNPITPSVRRRRRKSLLPLKDDSLIDDDDEEAALAFLPCRSPRKRPDEDLSMMANCLMDRWELDHAAAGAKKLPDLMMSSASSSTEEVKPKKERAPCTHNVCRFQHIAAGLWNYMHDGCSKMSHQKCLYETSRAEAALRKLPPHPVAAAGFKPQLVAVNSFASNHSIWEVD